MHDTEGGTTYCPGCGDAVIVRDWYRILQYRVTPGGLLQKVRRGAPGRFEEFKKPFGPRRVPVRLANFHAA